MPASVHKIFPDKPPEFDEWVFPKELKASTLIASGQPIAKLVLIHCYEDNRFSDVFEKDIPVGQAKVDLSDSFESFIEELTPENYTARVKPNEVHISALGDESTGRLGLIVRHSVYVTLN